METNIILAGVGGQGILAISFVIDMTAIREGLQFKQAETHGMSQRGGAVVSHLRVSDSVIHSDLIARGKATLILGVEPLESLRYLDFLSPEGTVVTGIDPFMNIDNYGDMDQILEAIEKVPNHIMLPSDRLARQAGTAKAQNMVMLGAATPYLQLADTALESSIAEAFATKGERIQQVNIKAFRIGKAAGKAYRSLLAAGVSAKAARAFVGRLDEGSLPQDSMQAWTCVLKGAHCEAITQVCDSKELGKIVATRELANAIGQTENANNEDLSHLLFGNS